MLIYNDLKNQIPVFIPRLINENGCFGGSI
jgi:hypothetical protein